MPDIHFHGGPRALEKSFPDEGADWLYGEDGHIEYGFDRYRAGFYAIFSHVALDMGRIDLIQGRRQ